MKTCLLCGNSYTESWSKQKYCSRKCANKSFKIRYKGKILSPNQATFKKGNQINRGRSPWNKGRKWSDETRQKISKTLTGRPTGRTGALSHFWKGGKTDEYRRIKNSIHWKNWRRGVFERDNYTCQECGAKSGNGKTVYLHPHHLKERKNYPELQFEISNGITLCRSCHRKTDNYGANAYRSTGATS